MFDNRRQKLDILLSNVKDAMNIYITKENHRLDKIKHAYILKNPKILYENKKNKLSNLIDKLELINPLGILKRGYAVAYKDGKVLSSIKGLKSQEQFAIRLQDGIIETVVKNIKEI